MSVSTEDIIALYDQGKDYQEIAREFNMHYEAVRSRIRRWEDKHTTTDEEIAEEVDAEVDADFNSSDEPPEWDGGEPQVSFRVDGDKAVAHSTSPEISSLQELLSACKADLSLWKVKDWTANAWSMGRAHKIVKLTWEDGRATGFVDDDGNWNVLQNFQIKAWFTARKEYPLEQAVNNIIEKMASHAPIYTAPKPMHPFGQHLLVPSLFDVHMNKLSVDGNYTVQQAAEDYVKVAMAILERAIGVNMDIGRILFVVGQDALHTDNFSGTTSRGTWVERAGHEVEAIDALCSATSFVVENMANVAPVDIISVPGNHDTYSTYWLGKYLAAWFRNHEGVNVLPSPEPRQYYLYGKTLLGIDHGNKVKPADLALTMAVESPKKWGASTYRECLRGHLHHRANMVHPVTEEKGVLVRFLPALCPPDKWHQWEGYVGANRAGEALFYSKTHGASGGFPVFVDEVTKA